ncbi:MAG TPA: ABC transporter substrate-binding protein, partial [Bacillota bacterium]
YIATREQGLDLIAIAPSVEQYTLVLVVGNEVLEATGVTAESSLADKMKALAEYGAKIGISDVGASTDLFVRHLCSQTGVDCDNDLELIPLGSASARSAAFQQRQVDGVVHSPPASDRDALSYNGTNFVSGPRGDVPSLSGYLYVSMGTTERLIEQNREQLLAFLRATGKAIKFVHAFPDEARALAKAYAAPDLDDETFTAAWETMLPALPKDLVIDAAGVDTTFKVVEELEQRTISVAQDQVYRTDLAEEAWNAISGWEPQKP